MQALRREGQGRMHDQALLMATDRPQATGCRMVGVVEERGILDRQHERIGGHAFQGALLMRQQDVRRLSTRVVKEGVGRFGSLPIGAGLINRRLRVGAKRFFHDEQPPVQALVAQVQSVELAYTPTGINLIGHGSTTTMPSAQGENCTHAQRECHMRQ